MTQKKIWIMLCALCLHTYMYGAQDSSRVQLSYRLSGVAGAMMLDDKVDPWIGKTNYFIGQKPLSGAEFAVEFQPTGRWSSMQDWNNSSVGIGATYIHLGGSPMLGDAFAIHAYLNQPFYRSKHFVIGLRPTVGVAFCTKTYQNTFPTDNPHGWQMYQVAKDGNGDYICNWSIGSVVNAYLAVDLFMDFPIQRGFDITCSFGWHHISNGSIKHPNSGYNMFLGEIGLRYTPGQDAVWCKHHDRTLYEYPETHVPKKLYDGVSKKWDVEMSLTGGVKQNYYHDNYPKMQYFAAATFGIAAHWIPVSIFKIGGGFDLFFDDYYRCVNSDFATANPDARVTYFGKTYLKESNIANCFRVGFSVQPTFVIGKLTAGIHVGCYLYDPIKNLEPYGDAHKADQAGTPLDRGIFYAYDFSKASNYADGWCYTQFILKYRVLEHLFVQVGLKTHGVRAEFIDAGLGVSL